MDDLCKLFGVTRQAYYKAARGEKSFCEASRNIPVTDFAKEIRTKDLGIGARKLWQLARATGELGLRMGRDKFERILRNEGLMLRKRRHKPQTTDSRHALPTYPNLIKDLIPERPCQIWVSDITYLRIYPPDRPEEFVYLSFITDAYTHEIMGFAVGPTLEVKYPLQALADALERARKRGIEIEACNLIHHSDRGCQYAGAAYTACLAANKIRISMTESGDPKENPIAERINGIIKREILAGLRYEDLKGAGKAIAKAVDFYNEKRPHMSNGMKTPSQMINRTGRPKKSWRSLREEHILSRVSTGKTFAQETKTKVIEENLSVNPN